MKSLLIITALLVLIDSSKTDFCHSNFTLRKLPEEILKDTESITTTGTIDNYFGCLNDIHINEDKIKLWLFTRNNPNTPILLDKNNPTEVNPDKPIKIILPGWICTINGDKIPYIRDAYLKRYDCNVIVVDWTKYSFARYGKSYRYVPLVANVITNFLCFLSNTLAVDMSSLHIVGHSMGGQMGGFVGQEVKKQCHKMLGRITALDPAGPLYQGIDKDRRLDKSDAIFVVVIHTNQGILGYFGDCGTKDFYVNTGTYQPGCLAINGNIIAESMMNLPPKIVGCVNKCSHVRSVEYMAESINSNGFIGTSCRTCPYLCKKDVILPTYTVMGEGTPMNTSYHKYYVPTHSKPPYAKGK